MNLKAYLVNSSEKWYFQSFGTYQKLKSRQVDLWSLPGSPPLRRQQEILRMDSGILRLMPLVLALEEGGEIKAHSFRSEKPSFQHCWSLFGCSWLYYRKLIGSFLFVCLFTYLEDNCFTISCWFHHTNRNMTLKWNQTEQHSL